MVDEDLDVLLWFLALLERGCWWKDEVAIFGDDLRSIVTTKEMLADFGTSIHLRRLLGDPVLHGLEFGDEIVSVVTSIGSTHPKIDVKVFGRDS